MGEASLLSPSGPGQNASATTDCHGIVWPEAELMGAVSLLHLQGQVKLPRLLCMSIEWIEILG